MAYKANMIDKIKEKTQTGAFMIGSCEHAE